LTIGTAGIIGRQKTVRQNKQVSVPPKDSDGGGIFDSRDACPLVPGFLKYHGCPIPDRDRNGNNDKEDKCPDIPGVLRYARCPIPDLDKDGIDDETDQCPDIFGVIRYQGCLIPDLDGDGLNDQVDDCPTFPGPETNKGCPILKQELINQFKQAARNIFFATGKFELLSKSYAALSEVVNILKTDKTLDLMIEGHTDNSVNAKANFLLSENRAKSVINYLQTMVYQSGVLERKNILRPDRLTAAQQQLEWHTTGRLK
jgi:OmpA-OmpF porin, OOP family